MLLNLPDKQFFRPDEVATLFNTSVRTVYYWIEHGKLGAVPLGGDDGKPGVIRVPREAIITYYEARKAYYGY